MTDEELEKFWLGLGANGWYLGEIQVYYPVKGGFEWLDPTDAEKVRLEVLLDGLERLSNGRAFIYLTHEWKTAKPFYAVCPDIIEWSEQVPLADNPDRRAAIIAAILKLEVRDGQA